MVHCCCCCHHSFYMLSVKLWLGNWVVLLSLLFLVGFRSFGLFLVASPLMRPDISFSNRLLAWHGWLIPSLWLRCIRMAHKVYVFFSSHLFLSTLHLHIWLFVFLLMVLFSFLLVWRRWTSSWFRCTSVAKCSSRVRTWRCIRSSWGVDFVAGRDVCL